MIKAQLCAMAAMLLAGCASSLAPPAVRPGPFDEPPFALEPTERADRWRAAGYEEELARGAAPGAVRVEHVDDMTPWDALKVGLVQCFAMIPGTSRSGATIIGGMMLGLSRKAATEFSFFLAIPTLLGATFYSLYKERALLSAADLPLFGIGAISAFVSAFLCVRWLLRYISTHDFTIFAWYRIVFGIVVLATAYTDRKSVV